MNKTAGVFILILLLLSGFVLGLLAEDIPPNICERALFDCLDDPMNSAWGAYGTAYCLVGYAFCKRYIGQA